MISMLSSDDETVYSLPASPDWIASGSRSSCVRSTHVTSPSHPKHVAFRMTANQETRIAAQKRPTRMKPSAVRRRDPIGPRTVPSDTSTTQPSISRPSRPLKVIEFLLKLQSRQVREHRNEGYVYRRRANCADVNKMLKWSFRNAIEWASNFDPFRRLSNESQKCALSEYGIAFFLVDQGFKSNGSYIHPDYFLGHTDKTNINQESVENHRNFYNVLVTSISRPFKTLNIDEFEIAALKSLLLLTPSFPKERIFVIYEEKMCTERKKCFDELMNHVAKKCPGHQEERFGELILLLGGIRNAVKAVYNQTKLSDVFDSSKFDPYVNTFLVS